MIQEVLDPDFRPRDFEALKSGRMNWIVEQFMYKPGKSTEMGDLTNKAMQRKMQHLKRKN